MRPHAVTLTSGVPSKREKRGRLEGDSRMTILALRRRKDPGVDSRFGQVGGHASSSPYYFVSVRFVPFPFVLFRFILFCFVWFCLSVFAVERVCDECSYGDADSDDAHLHHGQQNFDFVRHHVVLRS